MIQALREKDIDEERLAKARAEEQAAIEAYKEAEEVSGAKKQAIFEERKQKEEEMKRAEASKPVPVQQIAAAAAPQKIEGTGSVWNTNSYHWEEKSVAVWSNDTLRSIISGFTHKMNDSTLSIQEITKMEGEASVSIRKGKKIVSFDYAIDLKWQVVLADSDGNQISKMEGKYEMPEVSSDEEWTDWETRVEYGEDKDNLRSMLD